MRGFRAIEGFKTSERTPPRSIEFDSSLVGETVVRVANASNLRRHSLDAWTSAKSTHREGIGRFLSTNRWRRARRGSNLRRLSRPFSRARMRVAVDVFSPCVAQYRR